MGMATSAKYFRATRAAAAAAVRVAHSIDRVAGERTINTVISAAKWLTGAAIPSWSKHIHHPSPLPRPRAGRAGVLIPACVGTIAGRPQGAVSPAEALLALSERAGQPLRLPKGVASHCCGLMFDSKGCAEGRLTTAAKLVDAAWQWSEEGRLPVVIDVSSCAHALLSTESILPPTQRERLNAMDVTDAVGWLHRILDHLPLQKIRKHVILHPTCSTHHLGLVDQMREVAAAAADQVTVPVGASCCGMAGDRGLIHPELSQGALEEEAQQIEAADADGHYSCSPFCEAGLARATGREWHPLVLLLHEAISEPG